MLRLVTDSDHPGSHKHDLAQQLRAIADLIDGGLNVEYGLIVASVDGAVDYAPLNDVTLIEATGLLELVSRKVERDLTR